MQTIKFSTGRFYDAEQILDIVIESDTTDEYGIRDIVATFNDTSRHIKGRVIVAVFNDGVGQSVLDAYDAGRYQTI